MSTAYATRLKIRLFLEGVEIPVIAANVSTAPNSPSVAAIQIPPLTEGTRLLPRTLVHLYFLDFHASKSPFVNPGSTNEDGTERPNDLEEILGNDIVSDDLNRNYKLLFVGEVMGFAWTKSQAGRSLVLQCEDLSNYWDYAFQYENNDIFGPGVKAVFSGGATNLFTDFLSDKGSVVTQIVASGRCNSYPKLKGLSAGIVRLIEAIGGTYFPRPGSNAKKVAGQNLFFSIAELRLHLTGMITAYENDPTSERILQRQGYTSMFDRALGGMGGQTSIRQAITALTRIMFHETYAQPCPLFIPGSGGQVSGVKRTRVKGHPQWGFIADESEKAVTGLETILSTLQEAAGSDETDARALAGVIAGMLQTSRATLLQTVTRLRPTAKSKPPEVAKTAFTSAAQAVGVAATRMPQWRPKGPDSTRKLVTGKLEEALTQLRRCVDLTIIEDAAKDPQPARLAQQILRPDIWFGSPPRCNVIFPENYDTFQYQRMFMQEPTRFMLKTNDEFFGEDELFDKLYFAPQAGSLKEDKARLSTVLGRDLLDHERFTGILPVFEKMGEFNVFAARSGQATGKIPKVGLAQRSTNFLYFKQRFQNRKGSVQGKFNPYIACGFPGLILDKYLDLAAATVVQGMQGKTVKAPYGTNILANFTQVTHELSQSAQSATTQITLTYARQHDESVEFLGTLPENAKVAKKTGTEAVRSTDVAAVSPPKLYAFGPNLGRITAVQDVTELYVDVAEDIYEDNPPPGKVLPLFDVGIKPSRSNKATLVPVGVVTNAREVSSAAVEAITGGPENPVVFKAFRVTEEIPQYRREEVLLPAEEYIRPGWYGDVWSPSKIAEVYNAFFSIGSITEPSVITGPGGSGLGQTSEASQDAAAEQQTAEGSDDPRKDAVAALTLEEGASIQQAVEFLQLSYSFIRQQGLDVDQFIRSYTWRPIATMVDMFGTSNLAYSKSGNAVVEGIEGFHSKAFGDYQDLFGLIGPDVEDILGIKRGSTASVRADTRAAKRAAVMELYAALTFSHAHLG